MLFAFNYEHICEPLHRDAYETVLFEEKQILQVT